MNKMNAQIATCVFRLDKEPLTRDIVNPWTTKPEMQLRLKLVCPLNRHGYIDNILLIMIHI